MFRPNTMPRPHTTTTRRSCSTPSCQRNPASRRLRLAICPLLHSVTLNRTHGRMPAATMPRSRITPTTQSVTSTLRPPRRHSGSQHRRSTHPSTSRLGKMSSARRFRRSTCRPETRSPSRRQSPRDRNPRIQPSHKEAMQRFATSTPASRPGPSISTARPTRNRRLQSIAPLRPACLKGLPTRTPPRSLPTASFRSLPCPLRRSRERP